MRLSCDPVTRPELCKSVCEVWDGSKWTSQQSVSIVTAKQRREEDKKAGAERRSQSVPVDVRGAYGPSATSINGVYEPTSEVCGGWPVYRKQGDPDKWLEYIVATNEVRRGLLRNSLTVICFIAYFSDNNLSIVLVLIE